jgi:hypothetical protein
MKYATKKKIMNRTIATVITVIIIPIVEEKKALIIAPKTQ